jgi:FKBP-type peptidyl-prolyl cis-trans isomerase SlyD
MFVSFSYDLYDGEDDLVETSDDAAPIQVIHGYGQLAPALERALDGLAAGETRRVKLRPPDAFGARDRSRVVSVDALELPAGAASGDELEAEGPDGEIVPLMVLDVADGVAIVDAHHPLAGQTVTLDLAIEDVRPATGDELERADRLLREAAGAGPLLPAGRLIPAPRRRYEGVERDRSRRPSR